MRLIQLFLVSIIVFVCGCSTSSTDADFAIDVDSALESLPEITGETVSIRGYLSYDFEDKNLYASERHARDYDQDHCISIGVANDAIPDLEGSNDQWVTVSGTLTDDFCPPDTICMASCSQVGIFVEALQSARE
tara:strand:+ start:502 stop:903 length:402 start_codon:yes stop_codon:yes gene_type:complete